MRFIYACIALIITAPFFPNSNTDYEEAFWYIITATFIAAIIEMVATGSEQS